MNMKIGRNDPCPCGSGKKYKRCCMDSVSKQTTGIQDEIAQVVAMNPNLSLDELNLVLQNKVEQQNSQPIADFCGLSSTQMANWMYSPFDELEGVEIRTPDDLSSSPVMMYLQLIIDVIESNGGSLKATAKGNLPVKVVKPASELLPGFAVSAVACSISISEFAGNKEDAFNALHYARVLAELCGIIYLRKGHFQVKKTQLQKYQKHGLSVFFSMMLEAAIKQFNWGYLDAYQDDVRLDQFWLFMVWRCHCHSDVRKLYDEVKVAFPDLMTQIHDTLHTTPENVVEAMIDCRFISRFLQYWGFAVFKRKPFSAEQEIQAKLMVQPLLQETFRFLV